MESFASSIEHQASAQKHACDREYQQWKLDRAEVWEEVGE